MIELLVVIGVIGLLAGILLPALAQGRVSARRSQCIDNQRQLFVGTQIYWSDHDDMTFRYLVGSTNGGRLYWFGWLKPGAEGTRDFDSDQGALADSLGPIERLICPSLDYQATIHKLKARAAACNYGYNYYLGKTSQLISRVAHPTDTLLFADAAQVNDFQAPATSTRPLLEEFYYVDANEGGGYPNAHFRHQDRALAVFVDGHVAPMVAVEGTRDLRLPSARVGYLPRESLIFAP